MITEHTAIIAPTETSIPPVMITTVIPMPISAIGATAPSNGWIEPADMKAGVAKPRITHSTAITPTSTISWPVTGGARTR